MDQAETQAILQAILPRLEELSAEAKRTNLRLASLENTVGELKSDVADLKADMAGLKTELRTLRQETMRRFDHVDETLKWAGAKLMEHDEAIFTLKRKQA